MNFWQRLKKNWKENNSVSRMEDHWSIHAQADLPVQVHKTPPAPPAGAGGLSGPGEDLEEDLTGPSRREIQKAIRGLQRVEKELNVK